MADVAQPCQDRVRRRRSLRDVPIDLADLFDQPCVILGDADDLCGTADVGRSSRHFLQQPGAERVEFPHTCHIDRERFCVMQLRFDGPNRPSIATTWVAVHDPIGASSRVLPDDRVASRGANAKTVMLLVCDNTRLGRHRSML